MKILHSLVLSLAATAAALGATAVQAQVGPSASESARYQGLHAAAHAGDAARIATLAPSDSSRRSVSSSLATEAMVTAS